MENNIIAYEKSEHIINDMQHIIDVAQRRAYQSINQVLVQRNWLLGKRIAEEVMQGESLAEYGAKVIKELAKELTKIYGKGFSRTNLYNFLHSINISLRLSSQ